MTLLRLRIYVFPADVLADIQTAVLNAAPCELRTALLRELDRDEVRVTDAGRHLEEALDRYAPLLPVRGYR